MRSYLRELGSRPTVGSSLNPKISKRENQSPCELLSRHAARSGDSAKGWLVAANNGRLKEGTSSCGNEPIVAAAVRVGNS